MLRAFTKPLQRNKKLFKVASKITSTSKNVPITLNNLVNSNMSNFGLFSSNQRFFSQFKRNTHQINTKEKLEIKEEKNIEAGSVAAELPLKGLLGWILRFADKDPKKDDKNKKSDDNEGGDFDPQKFFNDNKENSMYAILALMAVLLYYSDDIRENLGLYQKITFQELTNLINQNQVKKIKIQKVVDERDFRFQAIVDTSDGKYLIHIGNVDSFTENIERIQLGYSSNQQYTSQLGDEYQNRVMTGINSIKHF